MAYNMLLIATILCVLGLTNASLAPFITPCKWNDKACAQASASKALPIFADGLPDFGVEKLDPVHLDIVDSSIPNLKFILSDTTVQGLKDCEVTELQRDETSSKITLTLTCSVKLDGQYEIDGSLLTFPLSGKGKIHVELNKAIFYVDLDVITKTGADGKSYWHIKRFHHKFELPNKSVLKFDKLLQDNAAISQGVKSLLEDNSNDVIKEIGNGMIVSTITRIVKNINAFFKAVPIQDLSLN